MTSTVTTAEAGVRALLEELAAAMRAKDADRVAECHLPGAVVYDLAPPLGKVFDREATRAWFAGKDGPMGYELRDVTVVTAGEPGSGLAVAYGLARMGDAAGSFELWFRTTTVLREAGGRWLIAHEHESTPFHMDGSMRAAVDLRP
jgi:ketosteroid isomerase-like protein